MTDAARHITAPEQALRFLLLGAANTAATSVGFYVLARWLGPAAAFTIVYAAGLAFVTLTTPRLVFGREAGAGQKAALAAWYVGVYICGLLVVRLLHDGLHASRITIVLGTLAVTAPLNFVGARLLIARH
jgi:hypothetical protein